MNNPVLIESCELEPINATCFIRRQDPAAIPHLLSEAANTADPADLFMKMFYIFGAYGQDATALQMQSKALEFRKLFRIVAPQTPQLKLLALVAAGDMMDNAPLDFLIENSDVQLELLYVDEHLRLPLKVPEHDVMYLALGESPKNNPILQSLSELVKHWPRPTVNDPLGIGRCARDVFGQLMRTAPNVRVANTLICKHTDLAYAGAPFTLRPVGSHAGRGFVKINSHQELSEYISSYKEDQCFYRAEFLEYQSEDGLYRKYRIALISGVPYICHLAISENWMVHYFPSGMELSQSKRDEEEREMNHFDAGFAKNHAKAFAYIYSALGLDYVVLDCAQTQTGELLVFEADSGAWVHATDPVEIFPYKRPVMQKVFFAFREMLARKAQSVH